MTRTIRPATEVQTCEMWERVLDDGSVELCGKPAAVVVDDGQVGYAYCAECWDRAADERNPRAEEVRGKR